MTAETIVDLIKRAMAASPEEKARALAYSLGVLQSDGDSKFWSAMEHCFPLDAIPSPPDDNCVQLFIVVEITGNRKSSAIVQEELVEQLKLTESFVGELMGARKRPLVRIHTPQGA